jgi:hypothetical protein
MFLEEEELLESTHVLKALIWNEDSAYCKFKFRPILTPYDHIIQNCNNSIIQFKQKKKISLLGFFIGSGHVYPIGSSYFECVKRVVSGYPVIFVS